MGELESRTLCSGTPVKVIHIGPNQSVKTLEAARWPRKNESPVKFVVDYSAKPYILKHHAIWGNLTIEAADPSHKPTFQLQDKDYPTLYVNQTFTIRNIKTVGGRDIILLGSTGAAKITAENITLTDGGAMWLGSGGDTIKFKNNESFGKPHNYFYANFNARLKNLTIDHSGTKTPIQQGGRMVNGKPIGEAAIRLMNVDYATFIGIKTSPWFYKPGMAWKQDVQLRPTAKLIKVINCNFYQADVGDMLWRKPALPMGEVQFINCTFVKSPHITNGVHIVKIIDCRVSGRALSRTM